MTEGGLEEFLGGFDEHMLNGVREVYLRGRIHLGWKGGKTGKNEIKVVTVYIMKFPWKLGTYQMGAGTYSTGAAIKICRPDSLHIVTERRKKKKEKRRRGVGTSRSKRSSGMGQIIGLYLVAFSMYSS